MKRRGTTDPPLSKLAGTLVLANPQQLDHALLIRRKSAHLAHQITHKLDTFRDDLNCRIPRRCTKTRENKRTTESVPGEIVVSE